jgi:ribonucleotide monophosphatase NagD (HAD superfamily)
MDKRDIIKGHIVPAVAPTIEALKLCSSVKDHVNMGKPETALIHMARDRDSLDLTRACLFGDKMETDILCAKRAGMRSVLVCTGADTPESVEKYDYAPDAVLPTLETLYNLIKE